MFYNRGESQAVIQKMVRQKAIETVLLSKISAKKVTVRMEVPFKFLDYSEPQ